MTRIRASSLFRVRGSIKPLLLFACWPRCVRGTGVNEFADLVEIAPGCRCQLVVLESLCEGRTSPGSQQALFNDRQLAPLLLTIDRDRWANT